MSLNLYRKPGDSWLVDHSHLAQPFDIIQIPKHRVLLLLHDVAISVLDEVSGAFRRLSSVPPRATFLTFAGDTLYVACLAPPLGRVDFARRSVAGSPYTANVPLHSYEFWERPLYSSDLTPGGVFRRSAGTSADLWVGLRNYWKAIATDAGLQKHLHKDRWKRLECTPGGPRNLVRWPRMFRALTDSVIAMVTQTADDLEFDIHTMDLRQRRDPGRSAQVLPWRTQHVNVGNMLEIASKEPQRITDIRPHPTIQGALWLSVVGKNRSTRDYVRILTLV
jgi:hypothetical protein